MGDGDDADGPLRHPRGGREHRAVPGLGRVFLLHRRDPAPLRRRLRRVTPPRAAPHRVARGGALLDSALGDALRGCSTRQFPDDEPSFRQSRRARLAPPAPGMRSSGPGKLIPEEARFAMAHGLVIRGGLIVDGTGAPGYSADLGVSGGRIAEIGAIAERGAREIDAGGLVVAPGFIDPHTHYDAQLTWDPSASCTSWHGVTTIVTGNCGFTIAPCRPEDRLTLMKMLEYVEGMSLEAMRKGIGWEFETFREYLDALDRLPLSVNVAPLIGHSAVRQFVMGEAAWERAATPDELERMGAEVRRAMGDGAIGFSSTTNMNHVGDRGRPVPSRLGTDGELEYLTGVMGATGRGIVELTIGGSRADRVGEVDRYMELARAARRPITMVSVRHDPARPEEHRQILARVEAAWREGLRHAASTLARI